MQNVVENKPTTTPHVVQTDEAISESAGNRFILVTEWHKHHPWPSTNTLRHLIFHKEKFGFDVCIRRLGRRVLISEKDFFAWLESDGGNMAKKGH